MAAAAAAPTMSPHRANSGDLKDAVRRIYAQELRPYYLELVTALPRAITVEDALLNALESVRPALAVKYRAGEVVDDDDKKLLELLQSYIVDCTRINDYIGQVGGESDQEIAYLCREKARRDKAVIQVIQKDQGLTVKKAREQVEKAREKAIEEGRLPFELGLRF